MNKYQEIDHWVRRYQTGDSSAGEMLVITFKPLVLSTMAKVHPGPEDQEDAFQDGILALLEGAKRYDPNRGRVFAAFIKTHLWQFFIKRQSGRFQCSIKASKSLNESIPGQEELTLSDLLLDETVNIEAQYLQKTMEAATLKKLKKGLGTLTQSQLKIIDAHYYKGQSLRECALNWGLSPSSVKTKHRRAIEKIKKML